jgi:transposase
MVKLTIENLSLQNRRVYCLDLVKKNSESLNISIGKSTIWNAKHNLKFNYKPPKIRQQLNQEQIEKG